MLARLLAGRRKVGPILGHVIEKSHKSSILSSMFARHFGALLQFDLIVLYPSSIHRLSLLKPDLFYVAVDMFRVAFPFEPLGGISYRSLKETNLLQLVRLRPEHLTAAFGIALQALQKLSQVLLAAQAQQIVHVRDDHEPG